MSYDIVFFIVSSVFFFSYPRGSAASIDNDTKWHTKYQSLSMINNEESRWNMRSADVGYGLGLEDDATLSRFIITKDVF